MTIDGKNRNTNPIRYYGSKSNGDHVVSFPITQQAQ